MIWYAFKTLQTMLIRYFNLTCFYKQFYLNFQVTARDTLNYYDRRRTSDRRD